MSDLATQIPNRSVRRQLSRAQSKMERKEEKKLRKNAPDSVRFNSKKSRKVVPYSPIKAALIEKDTAAPKKKDGLSDMFVPAVVTDKIPATLVTAAAAKMPEEASEVNTSQQDEPKELPEEQEESLAQQQQEPPLPELASSSPPSQEEAFKENSHESATNEEKHNASSPRAAHDTVSISDKTESVSINQRDHQDDETKNATGSDVDPMDKYDEAEGESNLVTANDETSVVDTNKEIKEENKEEDTLLQKDTTPAPSMTTSASISDKISPSTSTSSNKRKPTLISRLFKHKNSSKKVKLIIKLHFASTSFFCC